MTEGENKTKRCFTCKAEFPSTNEYFEKNKQNKGGLSGSCRVCRSIRSKAWREKNKEYKSAKDKEYRLNHKEEICKNQKQYREQHMEKIVAYRKEYSKKNGDRKRANDKIYYVKNKDSKREYDKQYRADGTKSKKYREENKDKIRERQKIYFEKNREKYREQRKGNRKHISGNTAKWRLSHPDSCSISRQKRRTARQFLLTTLTEQEWITIKDFFSNLCAYCGQSLSLTQDHFIPLSRGGEYTKQNIIPACRCCNSSKSTKLFGEWYPDFEHYDKSREEKILQQTESGGVL